MANTEDTAFKNIDYKNKTISKPLPEPMTDVDMSNTLTDAIIDASNSGTLDNAILNSFSTVSRSREEVLNLLDIMGEDPTISTALSIYAADVCEPSESGKIIWCVSDDDKITNMVDKILESLNIDDNIYNWVYALCKYGDVYLRLYRNSDFDRFRALFATNTQGKEQLNERLIVNKYSKNDHYANYIEMIKNPAEMFDLTKFGKTFGFIRTVVPVTNQNQDYMNMANTAYLTQRRKFNIGDVDVFDAKDFVHISLDDNSERTSEEVTLINGDDEDSAMTFSVKRGQSILYNSFKVWRELSLLENSVLLNRITKSSIIRAVNVEVGDMDRVAVRNLLAKIKQMFEQKSALNTGKTYADYTNPGPVENVVYMPTHDGKGAIQTSEIGSDSGKITDELNDLSYWKNKLFGSLGIPKQFLGDTNDSTGFNGGSSLSLISSRYAKTVKRLQNAVAQGILDAVNLTLYDNGLEDYIGKFTLKMQAPATQEEKERKDGTSTSINNISSIMNMVDTNIEDKQVKLNIFKILLSDIGTIDADVIGLLNDEVDKLATDEPEAVEEDQADTDDFSDIDLPPMPDLGGDTSPAEPIEHTTEPAEQPTETETPPQEGFNDHTGTLLAEDNLPNWQELGKHFNS